MSIYKKIQALIVESTYHSEVQRLTSELKKAKGTPRSIGLRKQLDQAMKAHYQGMNPKEFMEFSSDLVSTSKSKKGKGLPSTRKKS